MKLSRLTAVLIALLAISTITTDTSAMYHAGMGRFLQRDPGAGAGDPARMGAGGAPAATGRFIPRDPTGSNQYADGMNLYQYVRSNPITNLDPSGLVVRLWPLNGEVENNSKTATITISGDYVEITITVFITGTTVVRYPHSEFFRAWLLGGGPVGKIATEKEFTGVTYELKPGKDSWSELKAGNTKIVDADFITASTEKIYDSRNGDTPVQLPYKVGWATAVVRDREDGCGIYVAK